MTAVPVDGGDGCVLPSFETALDGLMKARADEGARIAVAIEDHLAQIEKLSVDAEASAAAQPAALSARLKQQIADMQSGLILYPVGHPVIWVKVLKLPES